LKSGSRNTKLALFIRFIETVLIFTMSTRNAVSAKARPVATSPKARVAAPRSDASRLENRTRETAPEKAKTTTRKAPAASLKTTETKRVSPAKTARAAKAPAAKTASAKTAKTSTNTKASASQASTRKTASKPAKTASAPHNSSVREIRAKRARVPADLAQQYGEKAARKKRPPTESAAARKARRNAEERAKLRQLMTPDEELLKRLAQLRGETSNGNGHAKRSSSRRSRSWESRCGKCGTLGTFQTQAALCTKCGAIAVRILE
jgi:hypothetical protein